MVLLFSIDGLSMEHVEGSQFKVYYSGKSQEIAKRILTVTEKSYPVFKKLFGTRSDVVLIIYWADKADWFEIPHCKYKSSYGMPHMTKGSNHRHYLILPAANVDLPDRLTAILEPMFDMTYLDKRDSTQLVNLLLEQSNRDRIKLREYLSSREFYIDYLINIVLIHELMHYFSIEFGFTENYGRDGRKAWWVFEGMAQWSVLWINRELGNEIWADIHQILYRWIYRSGREKEGNLSPLQYNNYAWFHGALVEMISSLEEKFDKEYGKSVLRVILHRIQGKDYLNDGEVINIFSEVSDQNLSAWFYSNWAIYSK